MVEQPYGQPSRTARGRDSAWLVVVKIWRGTADEGFRQRTEERMDQAAAYEEIYERISSLVDDENADVEVPTCPAGPSRT